MRILSIKLYPNKEYDFNGFYVEIRYHTLYTSGDCFSLVHSYYILMFGTNSLSGHVWHSVCPPPTSSANGRFPCGRTLDTSSPYTYRKETLGIQGSMTRKFEFHGF
jgi:hypothetical protein